MSGRRPTLGSVRAERSTVGGRGERCGIAAAWIAGAALIGFGSLALAQPDERTVSEAIQLEIVSAPLVVSETHTIEAPEIEESSGLVASRRHDGVLWTHNDSGDSARIFAISRTGEALSEHAVSGARNVDWEDIAIDDGGRLYLGDVGNNGNARRDLAVYVVPEPDPRRSGPVAVERVLGFHYTDQRGFPDREHMDFDCEAIVHADGAIYLFTKHRGNTRTKIYRLSVDEAADREQALAPLATLELASRSPLGVVTAADTSADGRVVLSTYTSLLFYQRAADGLRPSGPVTRLDLVTGVSRQVESVAWDGDEIVFGNEQRVLFRVSDPPGE